MSNNQQKLLAKVLGEMSPERRQALEKAFSDMRLSDDPIQPPMRKMGFGGTYFFDENRTQVELDGTFSKHDLMRIALVLND